MGEVETSPSKVERIDVVKNVAQRNLLAVRNKRGINSTELGQQSNLNEQAPSQPYYETFRVGSETELFKLNHSSYFLVAVSLPICVHRNLALVVTMLKGKFFPLV